MTLPAGTRLGQYEITAAIGAGGMGEVYRAHDTRLQRQVAIKVLLELAGGDTDRAARFQREAQVLASLNHPHIAQIYGIEDSTGVTAIVMELVEGPTLADRLAAGPLPLSEALGIARQIADALDAAHEQGIVHRDLKPANIKVRDEGTVKVLDFGLAKALDPAASGAAAMNSPTMSVRATMQGVILGTAAYMAPEQAKGRPVDKRADIWAFGAVLYEMLTRQQTFSGDSTTEILGAVVLKDPDWSALPASTPPALVDLLRRCLHKDPRQRQRDIGDVRIALDQIASGSTSGVDSVTVAPPAARDTKAALAIAVGASVVVGAIGLAAGWLIARNALPKAPATATRFIVAPPSARNITGIALSPHGRFLIIGADRLYLREFTAFEPKPLAGTEGAAMPFVSPDSRWVGFFANGKIKKVSVGGGDPLTIGEANGDTPGATWGSDNTILFSPGWDTPFFSFSADGGQSRQLSQLNAANQERGHWWPRILPGGKSAIFTIWRAASGINDARVAVLDLASRQHHVLFPGADAHYLSSGHILYFHAGAWHLVGFDLASQKTTGQAITVLNDATDVPSGGSPQRTLSVQAGAIAYMSGSWVPLRELVWADRAGRLESLGLAPQRMEVASLSPDGRRIAADRLEGGAFELWMYDLARKTEDRIRLAGSNYQPVWSTADDITFLSIRKGDFDVYAARADSGGERAILTDDFDQGPQAWDREGRRLIVMEWRHDGSRPLTSIDTAAGGKREVLADGGVGAEHARLSPDDRWLAYVAIQSGRPEVYVQAFPGSGPAVRVSTRGGDLPTWSRVGNELFYQRDNEVISVSYRDESGRFRAGDEKTLFSVPSVRLQSVAPDGRFLLLRRAEPAPAPGVRVVLNWLQELKILGTR